MPLSSWEGPSQCPFLAICSLTHLVHIGVGQPFILGAWTCKTASRSAQRLRWLDGAGMPGPGSVLNIAGMSGYQACSGEDDQIQRPRLDGLRETRTQPEGRVRK